MKVLHLVKTSVGAAWALLQIRELVKKGVEVHIAIPSGGPMVGRYAGVGATEHLLQTDFPTKEPWRFPRLAKSFKQLVNEVNPNIIHSHFVGTTLSMRLALGRNHPIPRIFQVPGPLHLEHTLYRNAEIATAGKADYWVGSCQWTCDRYRKSGVKDDRIFCSIYGVDIDQIAMHPAGKLRSELGIDSEIKIVGMVAYMYAPKRYLGQSRGLKGHEDLIDAIAICQTEMPKLRCVIIGGAWNNAVSYERHLREYALKKCGDNVIFLGTRTDVPDLYPDFDVAVHPSHSENLGGAGESMLNGIPTIATNIGGFPDLVKDGVTGWLVPPNNPPELAKAIKQVLLDREQTKSIALAGQRHANTILHINKTSAEIAAIYEKILKK